jgi:DNA replication protein DnaC
MKIEEQMSQLKLTGMLQSYHSLVQTHQLQNLSLGEGLELLLMAETEERINKRSQRLTQRAKFRYQASLSELNYLQSRNLSKTLIASLADCSYITKGQSIIITGATGCGKSYLASALGYQACQMGYKVMYISLLKLFNQLKTNRLDGTLIKTLEHISRQNLLIVDDFGISGLDQQQCIDLMEIIEDRHGRYATIIATQLPVLSWYDIIPDSTIAEAILDRLIHGAIKIELQGDSLRKKQ